MPNTAIRSTSGMRQPVVITAGMSVSSEKKGEKKLARSKEQASDEKMLQAENRPPEHPSNENEEDTFEESFVDVVHDGDDEDVREDAVRETEAFVPKKSVEAYSDDPHAIKEKKHGGELMDEKEKQQPSNANNILWLAICFFGIMGSFIMYGILLEYTTSGGRKLHELSFLFVTSLFYTITGAIGSHVRGEEPTTIPPARFAVLGLTSMGSTFCSVRSLRYVIFPIQVLAKSCKPVPVMIMGAFMGKKYTYQKYINVCLIVGGVALFMSGGSSKKSAETTSGASEQIFGIILLFVSLCFDGGTGAYEDKLMSVHSVGPFDLMYNIQLGKTILAGLGLLIFNEIHLFIKMCGEMGFLLVALGLSGALGQIFIFVTISKFGALTCSIIGLARKVTTLVASIYIYGHHLNSTQWFGLFVCVGAMILNFRNKKGGGHGHGHGGDKKAPPSSERIKNLPNDEMHPMVESGKGTGDVELGRHAK